MTRAPQLGAVTRIPAPRRGGLLRRTVLLAVTAASWIASFVFADDALPPGDGEIWYYRLALLLLALVLFIAPVLIFAVPALARIRRSVDALLAVAAAHPSPELPAYESWERPTLIFRRLVLTGGSYIAVPLLLCLTGAVAFGLFLEEPAAGLTFLGLGALPALVLLGMIRLPGWLETQARNGLAGGQLLSVGIARRIDGTRIVGQSSRTWFDVALPDGQRVLLRTPMHFSWSGDVRRLAGATDVVLVVAGNGWGGVLLPTAAPEAAVWLLGPVPVTRAPHWVTQSFAE